MKVINFFGGPGTGKSTTAAAIFSDLKQANVNAELVHEFAKQKTWENHAKALQYQPYITGKQFWLQAKLLDEVSVAVTDSPILLGCIFTKDENGDPMPGCGVAWDQAVIDMFNVFDNLNIFLRRNPEAHPYNPKGRGQTEEQAMDIDEKILKLLKREGIKYHTIEIGEFSDVVREVRRVLWEEGVYGQD